MRRLLRRGDFLKTIPAFAASFFALSFTGENHGRSSRSAEGPQGNPDVSRLDRMNPKRYSIIGLPLLAIAGSLFLALPGLRAQAPNAAGTAIKGSFQKITVHGRSLEGNLEGDSPDRDVFVYLPPSYARETTRRYPVVYFLHGYSVNAEAYVRMLNLPQSAESAMTQNATREMILVLPDAFTKYSGSMYSNSLTTGDWEGYVSSDLVRYIDSHYRTIANRDARGLAGHSMGGYGTVRIGMKQPAVFSSLYAMSSCCLMNNTTQGRGGTPAAESATPGNAATPAQTAGRGGRGGGLANALFAQAAAWAPNPLNPPQYFDLPTKDGLVQPLIAAKWIANSPLVMVDQYVPNLKQYRAIAMDVGNEDPLGAANKDLDQALTRLGISHTFEVYEGNHTNRVRERFETKVIQFFAQRLTFLTNN
jgi:enterochelin esterase-like enzyme